MSLESYKAEAIIAATELGYGSDIVDRINSATTEGEVTRALRDGRESL